MCHFYELFNKVMPTLQKITDMSFTACVNLPFCILKFQNKADDKTDDKIQLVAFFPSHP